MALLYSIYPYSMAFGAKARTIRRITLTGTYSKGKRL
jgi:hypothetical protein